MRAWSRGPACPPAWRRSTRGDYLFVISHLDSPAEVDLGSARADLLTGATVGPVASLAPRGVLVLACNAPVGGLP